MGCTSSESGPEDASVECHAAHRLGTDEHGSVRALEGRQLDRLVDLGFGGAMLVCFPDVVPADIHVTSVRREGDDEEFSKLAGQALLGVAVSAEDVLSELVVATRPLRVTVEELGPPLVGVVVASPFGDVVTDIPVVGIVLHG